MATEQDAIHAPHQPASLCGYAVVETLAPDASYLAIGPGGRGVVLKKLDPDCLYRGQLHPDVHDRLGRVRELALTGVANLFGVGKEGADAWLIWEYVDGQTFADQARERCPKPRELILLLRELVLTLESLHLRGLVHGSVQSGNAIVTPEGSIRLTHISPLLYTDPADDAESLVTMTESILEERNELESPLGRLMTEAMSVKMPLRTLAAKLAILADAPAQSTAAAGASSTTREERRTRRRAVAGALAVAVAAGAAAYGAWRAAGHPGVERLPTWLTQR